MVKFAFIIMYELRSINKTIDNLYKYIIDYYDADVFIVCQKFQNNDKDYEYLNLFNKNVVYKKIYNKPNPEIYFYDNNIKKYKSLNWNSYGNLQIYINLNEMSKIIDEYKDKYDYFISLRTDIDITFPFPPKELFENIPNEIYTFDAEYCRLWGGYSTGVFIHNKYIMNYLKSYFDTITNTNVLNEFINGNYNLNQETFAMFCLNKKNISFKYINNLNIYFTGEKVDSYYTWETVKYDQEYNVYYKYALQLKEAMQNKKLYDDCYRWKFVNGYFILLK